MSTLKNPTFLWLALASTVLIASCGRGAKSYVALGNDYFQKGKYEDASINYRKAIQKDARNGEAYFGLGKAATKQGHAQEAYLNLTRAEQLLPAREDVKSELGDLALTIYLLDPTHPQKLYDDVTRISRDLRAKNPRSFDGLRFAGAIALSDRKFVEAADDMEKANTVKPMDPNVVGPWVDALFQTDRGEQAEKLALALIDQHKDFGPIYDVLYDRYMKAKRVADAEKLLNTRIANNPGSKDAVLQLARHYASLQKTAEWTATLNKMLDNPKAFPDARADIGDFYLSLKNWDEASKQYNDGLQARPEKRNFYQKKIVNVLLAQQKRAEALAMLDQMVKANANDYGSRALRADLQLQSGNAADMDAALAELQFLTTALPHDDGPPYALGRGYLAKGNLEAARSEFLEALKRKSGAIPPRLMLAMVAQRRNDYAETLRYASEVLAVDNNIPGARLWHAVGLGGLKNYGQAETEFERLIKDYPQAEDVQLQFALMRLQQKKYAEADAILTHLYHPGSSDVRSVAALAMASAAQGDYEPALSSIEKELQKSPASVPLHSLLASLAALAGKTDLTIEENQWLVKSDPRNVNAYLRLADAYRQKGDTAASVAATQKASQLAPTDPKVLESAAYLELQSGRSLEALAEYRRLLSLDPNEATNLNNLAYLLADEGRDLDEALSLAGKATQKFPDNPGFRDTLAWVYVKKNMNDSAIQILTNLVRNNPDDPSFHYHLGIALLQKGDKEKARTELGLALLHKPSPNIMDKIKEAMAKIG